MDKKTLLAVLSLLGIISLANCGFMLYQYQQNKKVVVIDIIRVVNEFKLKKDLENRVAVKLNEFSNNIDSLKAVEHALVRDHAQSDEIMRTTAAIDTIQSRAQQAYTISNKSINEQVWIRLNTLISEYGEKRGYVLVIGANGMGTVLYNRKELDKTEELIKFVNEKYEKGH